MDKQLKDRLDIVLEDDDSLYGGTMFRGETVRDFLYTIDRDEEIATLDELNEALRVCGIKPVK